MDRLVRSDVKEVELIFQKGQKCTTLFKLTNLMHTMPVAVSLTTSDPSLFSVNRPFSVIPLLSSSSYTLLLSRPSDQPPLSVPNNVVTVRTSVLPTGKGHQDSIRRLFAKPGPHVFRDATISISFVGPEVAKFLISYHTQIPESRSFFMKAISGCTVSELTALLKLAVERGNADFVAALIQADADVNFRDSNGQSIMPLAVRVGDIDILRLLIDSGCEINKLGDLVLHEAAKVNRVRVDLMKILFQSYADIDVNLADSDGRTPIHLAAIHGHVKVIDFCLSIGGHPDVVDCKGWTPLHCAASEGQLKAVKCLLKRSNVKYSVNKDGKTAFSLAMENGHSNLLDLLHWGDVLLRAARVDDIHKLKNCLAEGATVDMKDQNGWTPLHWAAFKGRIKSVKILLEYGAKVDNVDDAGYTPLHCAVEAGHLQVALLLVSHGSKAHAKKSFKVAAPLNLDSFKKHTYLDYNLYQEQGKT